MMTMTTPLDEKRSNRFKLLHKLYDLTGGRADRYTIDIRKLGEEIGLDAGVALDTFEYLKGEGLTKWVALGGIGTITHWGVKEVEDALENKPTAHFPANIVVLSNSPGASVNTGTGNQIIAPNTTFDQRGQVIQYQYNAAGDINLESITEASQLASQLDLIKRELSVARENGAISELAESKARTPLLEAIEEASGSVPNLEITIKHLRQASEYLINSPGATDIDDALERACDWAEQHG
jgi:hypothetical protein